MNITAFTGTRNNPSSRFRIRQYMAELKSYGITVSDYSSIFGTFAPEQKTLRPAWVIANLIEHFFQVIASRKSDIAFVQREMLATLYTNERFIKAPVFLDVDDAIFLLRNGSAARKLAKKAQHIICGNTFLANWFADYNSNVSIVNTGVDITHFRPKLGTGTSQIIGWSGSSSGFTYLYHIEEALKIVLQKFPNCKLRIIADKPPRDSFFNHQQMEFYTWSEKEEVRLLQDLRVGIMPLSDNDWSKGKCSFKMLTYMSCSIPVVVSPVGMNMDVLSAGELGLGARTLDEWVDAISFYLKDETVSILHGKAGRKTVEDKFSHKVISRELSQIFQIYR